MSTNKKSNANSKNNKKGMSPQHRRVIINRIIVGVVAACVLVLLFVVMNNITNRGGANSDTSTITVSSEGIIREELASFDDSSYSKSELKKSAKADIKEYNSSHSSGDVKLNRVSVDDGIVYVKTTFRDATTYSDFSGHYLYVGELSEAVTLSNIQFGETYITVKDGKKDKEKSFSKITDESDIKVIVVNENVDIKVEGEILYVSDFATTVVNDTTVHVEYPDGNADATTTTFIFYKES